MKIVTWNINGYRSAVGQNPSRRYNTITKDNKLFSYIEQEKPDIICLQEIKAAVEQIDEDKRCPEGYEAFYHSCSAKMGYSGVATFSKIKPKKVNYLFGFDQFDSEGRLVETDFEDFILLNIYFPKGYANSDRLDFKLDFYDMVIEYCDKLLKKGRNLIISGDYNTAHKEIDLARPKENIGTSGFMPVEREKLDVLIERGYIDTLRQFHDEGEIYSWWSQRGRARDKNVGWRIDYHFVSKKLASRLLNAEHRQQVQGSDHCPVALEIK